MTNTNNLINFTTATNHSNAEALYMEDASQGVTPLLVPFITNKSSNITKLKIQKEATVEATTQDSFKIKHLHYLNLLLSVVELEPVPSSTEATGAFSHIYQESMEKATTQAAETEENQIYRAEKEELSVFSTGTKTFSSQTKKLLLFSLHQLTRQNTNKTLNNSQVVFSLDDYRQILRQKSLKKLATQILASTKTLATLEIEYRAGNNPLKKTKVTESAVYSRGTLIVTFSESFASHYLQFGSVLEIPEKLFSCDVRYTPGAVPLMFFLIGYYHMNKNKANSNTVLLLTALYYAGFHLEKKSGHHKQLVFTPFFKIMDEIFGQRWSCEDKNKNSIKKNEVTLKNSSQIRLRFSFEGGDA